MATFYLMPPRPLLAERLANYLESLLPGVEWSGAELTEALAAAVARHADVYVVYREDLPEGERPARALADGFGAEPGDEVIEVRAAGPVGAWSVRRWRLSGAA